MASQKETLAPRSDNELAHSSDAFDDAYESFMDFEPAPIPLFVPENGAPQKALFLRGDIENPNHHYDELDGFDFDAHARGLIAEAEEITRLAATMPKYEYAYDGIVDDYLEKTEFLKAAYDYKHATTDEERQQAGEMYMSYNKEIYGTPDKDIYLSLLAEKMRAIEAKQLTGRAAQLRDELWMIAPEWESAPTNLERFQPSQETVDWMHDVVEALYGNLLQHVPEQEAFTAQEVCDLFNTIIAEEFGESAEGWKAVLRDAKSINVRAAEKEIIIPIDRADMKRGAVRKLVVHEMGVHMLRAVTGEMTDVPGLRYGLAGFYDAEEGLGVVMEQALEGKYDPSRGVPSYISAGAAYYGNMNFRQLFEFQWRLSALDHLKTPDITEAAIKKKRDLIYNVTLRTMRGTDDLPWFKDLAYYNGNNDTWKYLESIRGDDEQFMFVLASGKINPANPADRRLAREIRTP